MQNSSIVPSVALFPGGGGGGGGTPYNGLY